MDTKQTQGEWKILGDLYTVSDDDGWPVAITALGMRDADECLANARLIAAAPDLLAVLQHSIALADRNRDALELLGHKVERPPEMQALYDQCVAAVAKATGAA